jgi:hypothetical protein
LNIEHNYEKVYANGSGSKQGGHDGKTDTCFIPNVGMQEPNNRSRDFNLFTFQFRGIFA